MTMNDTNKKPSSSGLLCTLIGIVALLGVLIYLLVRLTGSGYHIDVDSLSEAATKFRLQPEGSILLGDGVAPGKRDGALIFANVCLQCHAADAVGQPTSPKLGDKVAWAPRIAKGFEVLTHDAINGFNNGAMPARGGRADLTDEEVARAVAYMANAVGANFIPPPIEEDNDFASEEVSSDDASEAQ